MCGSREKRFVISVGHVVKIPTIDTLYY